MTARELVDFVETRLDENGVEKVIPEAIVIEQFARSQLETRYASALVAKHAQEFASRAAAAALPPDLAVRIAALLEAEPELSWDQALSQIIAEA